MFRKFVLNYDDNLFTSLSKSCVFEQFTPSRSGAILVARYKDKIPIVRTTTKYTSCSQLFTDLHYKIIEDIKKMTNVSTIDFNNAMIEIYDQKYSTMKFHSDQALDLAEDSYICLYSCYENEHEQNPKKLVIKDKKSGEQSELILEQNSIIIFSKSTNDEHLHKIVSDNINKTKSRWLGLTFRLSKTFIDYKDNVPYLVSTGQPLNFANEIEKKEFYKHKSLENAGVGYVYPYISYTLSKH